jgi:hypothetical protein
MGFNTTVLFLNDRLHEIAKDTQLGRRIAGAASRGTTDKDNGVGSGATIVNVSHADEMVMLLVGANGCDNYGSIAHWRHILRDEDDHTLPQEETDKRVLRCLARKMGYDISIKKKK